MASNLPNEHEIIRADQYINLALAALVRDSVLPRVFTILDGNRFKGAPSKTAGGVLGQALNYEMDRVAGPARDYDWRRRVDPIILDRIGTVTQQILLNKHIYHGVAVTNEQLTLDITNFGTQIATPQAKALREKLERAIVDGLQTLPFKRTDLDAPATIDPYRYALNLRRVLNAQGTPEEGRVLLVGDGVESWLLESDRLSRLSETGSTSALRQATLGDLAGFRVVRTSLIGEDEVFAMHPSAMLVANLAPEQPLGNVYAARQGFQGMSMLLTRDYDTSYQQSRSVISTYFGINSVNDDLKRATAEDVAANRAQFEGQILFDADGNPQVEAWNVRGARGKITGLEAAF